MRRIGHKPSTAALRCRFLLKHFLLLVVLTAGSVELTIAQDEDLPEGVVPPPLSVLSDDESESLEREKRLKEGQNSRYE